MASIPPVSTCCAKDLRVPIACAPRSRKKDWSACKTCCIAARANSGKNVEPGRLELVAQACLEQGIIAVPISDESVRRALKRLKTHWKRAKHWITSPDPLYQKKNRSRPIVDLGFAGEAGGDLGH